MLRTIPVTALCALLPLAAMAGDQAMTADDGRVFAEVALPEGSVLAAGDEVIRLTSDCGARIAGRGAGRWFWTGDGTTVRVGSYAVRLDGVPLLPLTSCVG